METPQQRELFELLDYAYIGARYDRDYKITREELEYLAERVQELQTITKKICKKRIKEFVDK
jgi:predicted transcriptional regulator